MPTTLIIDSNASSSKGLQTNVFQVKNKNSLRESEFITLDKHYTVDLLMVKYLGCTCI